MSFDTMPISLDEAIKLVLDSDGVVVSASKEEYFDNMLWMKYCAKSELKDDSITIFFTLLNGGFVEYCCVKPEDMTI